MGPGFRWYLAGVASWFAGWGLLTVLVPWLVAVVLRESPQRLGLAQVAVMGPSTVLLIVGGASADRADGRTLLIRYHLLALLPTLGLAIALAADVASYPVLLAYGLALGTLSAFITPARDALLTRIARGALPRAVALATAAQFVFQLAGIALAGTAARLGAWPLLVAQAVLLGGGAVAAWQLPPAPAEHGHRGLAAMRDAFRAVAESERILPVVIAMTAVGVLFTGAFVVALPVLIRDVHAGGAAELATVNFCFWGGIVASTLAQVRLRPMERPGRVILVTLAAGSVVLAAMALPVSFPTLASLCAVWGVGAGIVMTQARTIAQLAARDSHRARVLAVFQLGVTGSAPLGAALLGYLTAAVGPRQALIYPAVAMLAVLACLTAGSTLWRQHALTSPAA
jgi:MFS family permease